VTVEAATAFSESAGAGVIGFGGTDRASIAALFGPRHRSAPVGSGTTKINPSDVRARTSAAQTDMPVETYFSTEADFGTLYWDQRRCLLTFYTPTLAVSAVPTRILPAPLFAEYVRGRVLTLPIRWSLGGVVQATTTEQGSHSPPDFFSTTDALPRPRNFFWHKVSEAFAAAAEDTFEDGIETDFSRSLRSLIKTHGIAAVAGVEDLILSPETNIEVAVEATRLLGAVDDPASRPYRRTFLERLLDSASARIRHAAASALAAMDDPATLPALISAIERERNRRLRQYLELVVDQLEHTRSCPSS
jgi:hypothetical protein